MRAVWLTEFGAPEVLVAGEAPDPLPGPGQALVQVAVSGVTFIETWVRAGRWPRGGEPPRPPLILGNAVGGVVTEVGPDVDNALLGRRVVSGTGGFGGYAELAAVDAAGMVPVPDGLGLSEATALLADGRTATGLTRLAQPEAGEWVLVEAAAGGVGTLLVQLAAGAGANVIGAASGRRKLDLAERLGARVTVDYTTADWADQVRKATGGVGASVVFDGVGGTVGQAALDLTADSGRFVLFGLASGTPTDTGSLDVDRAVRVIGFDQLAVPGSRGPELTAAALAAAAEGRLHPVIGQTFPLERAADAHTAIEARDTVGKTLLLSETAAG